MNIEHNQLIDVYVGSPTPDAIECQSTIPSWAPIFEEHFPENPILPGALLVETMAQAASFIDMLKTDFSRMAYLAAVKSAKFKAYARAGESLVIRAQATHWDDHFMVCEAAVTGADGRALANAALTLKFAPFASDRMRHTFVTLLSGPRQAPRLPEAPHFSQQPASPTKEFIA
jgi:3-hydroxyacyl-[acyl-carrier-protein] dehydratase